VKAADMCANRSGGKRKEQGIKEELGSGIAFCANWKIARFKRGNAIKGTNGDVKERPH
jgi:hypothetical protein